MKNYEVKITLLSPLHLGAGHADVVTDAEAVRDRYGMPFFPGKRLKGLLYESALEMAEISSGKWFTIDDVKKLFAQGNDYEIEVSGIRVDNFYLPQYDKMCEAWEFLQEKYSGIFSSLDVWESYSELRAQTAIDNKTHTAAVGSLRNIRAVEVGTVFEGNIILLDDNGINRSIVEKAILNLRYAGAKRNRGFGNIRCTVR